MWTIVARWSTDPTDVYIVGHFTDRAEADEKLAGLMSVNERQGYDLEAEVVTVYSVPVFAHDVMGYMTDMDGTAL